MRKYIFMMLSCAFITIISGCSRADIENCETEYDTVIAITNFIQRFYSDWGILQMWPICWAITIVGKIKRS